MFNIILLELNATHNEIKGVHEDFSRGAQGSVQIVHPDVNNIGEMLSERIEDAKDMVANHCI